MKKEELKGYFEIKSFVLEYENTFTKKQLLDAMDISTVSTFGWPIGIVLHTDDKKPLPSNDGVIMELEDREYSDDYSYDYWKLTLNAELYILISLFEDRRRENCIFLDSRINRTTEALMRVGRLYQALNVDTNKKVAIELEYGGLEGRILTVASPNRHISFERKCSENIYNGRIVCSLDELLKIENIKEYVFEYLHPFFENFEFFDLQRNVSDEIVEGFYNGKVG